MSPDNLNAIASMGVEHLSIGVEALQDHHLKALHRPYTADQVKAAVDRALGKSFKCVNVDTIFALPNQTYSEVEQTGHAMVEMGVDQLDPVEVIPDGDLSIDEARRIAGDSLTITGNIQFRELLEFTPEQMKQRVGNLIRAAGPRRLIVSTTAVPAGPFSSRLEANYNVMIDTVLSY